MLSLVIPVYMNEAGIDELLSAVLDLDQAFSGRLEVIFVVDGSPDRSYEMLAESLSRLPIKAQLLLLSKNFGSFAAIREGLNVANGERFAVMAADLQEPPELIQKMNEVLTSRGDEFDIVVAAREARSDPLSVRVSSGIFWALYRKFIVPEMPVGGVDVFACNRAFRDQLLMLEERHSSLIAQIFWLGFRREIVTYKRQVRRKGKSAWTFRKKLSYLMDSVFSFTDLPIRLLIRIGGWVSLISGVFALAVLVSRLAGHIVVPGYAATVLAIVFLGSLNLFGLGIVGSYAWRAYENTKARPLAIVIRNTKFN